MRAQNLLFLCFFLPLGAVAEDWDALYQKHFPKELSTAESAKRLQGQLTKLRHAEGLSDVSIAAEGGAKRAKSVATSEGTEPRFFGNVPNSDRRDLLIAGGTIDHVFLSAAVSTGRFGAKETQLELQISAKSFEEHLKTARNSGLNPIVGYALPGLLERTDAPGVSIPLLAGRRVHYRAEHVCAANVDGKCSRDLSDQLEFRLTKATRAVPVFPRLRLEKAEREKLAKQKEFLKIEFVPLPRAPAGVPVVPSPDVVHPGDNRHFTRLLDALVTQYQTLLGEKGSWLDFVKRIRVADCDVYSLAVLQAAENAREKGWYQARGNRAEGAPFLDLKTENHAWNLRVVSLKDLDLVELVDRTPAPSVVLTSLITEKVRTSLEQTAKNLTEEKFSIESLLVRIPAKEIRLPATLYTRVQDVVKPFVDLESFEFEFPDRDPKGVSYPKEILEKLGKFHLYTGHEKNWIDRKKREAYFVQVDMKEVLTRNSGFLTIGGWTDEKGNVRVLFGNDLSRDRNYVADGFGWNWEGNADASSTTPKWVVAQAATGPSRIRRGYAWPNVSQEQLTKLAPEFLTAFPSANLGDWEKDPKKLDFISGPNDMKDGKDRNGGWGTIGCYRNDREFIPQGPSRGDFLESIPTDALVQFWRKRGFDVIPVSRLEMQGIIRLELK